MLKVELYGTALKHPLYSELIKYPPRGCAYAVKAAGIKPHWIKKTLDSPFLKVLHLVYREIFGYTPDNSIDLIHACDSVVLAKVNWVADFEHVGSLLPSYSKRLRGWQLRIHRKILERMFCSLLCKKIMPWSEAAKKSMLNSLETSKFEHKLEVVYPAIHSIRLRKKQKSEKINLLFVGREFLFKGGKETLETFKRLSKRYDVSLTMVSEVPEKYRVKYASLPNLRLVSNVPASELERLYRTADIFVLPTMADTFGFVFLEAMNFSLPVVTSSLKSAAPEIVEDEVTGFLVKPEISMYDSNYLRKYAYITELNDFIEKRKQLRVIRDLCNKLSILVESESLRRRMGREGKRRVEKGKFSIKARNEKLRLIYKEVVSK
jgi:glycosyltransferase involved in cell wall biosynthesis